MPLTCGAWVFTQPVQLSGKWGHAVLQLRGEAPPPVNKTIGMQLQDIRRHHESRK